MLNSGITPSETASFNSTPAFSPSETPRGSPPSSYAAVAKKSLPKYSPSVESPGVSSTGGGNRMKLLSMEIEQLSKIKECVVEKMSARVCQLLVSISSTSMRFQCSFPTVYPSARPQISIMQCTGGMLILEPARIRNVFLKLIFLVYSAIVVNSRRI